MSRPVFVTMRTSNMLDFLAIFAFVFVFAFGVLVGVMWASRMFRQAHLSIAESLSNVRKVLSRGDINTSFKMLESLENMVRRWEEPKVDDK